MKHLTISEYGNFIGVDANRLVVRNHEGFKRYFPLNRLATINIAKRGVSFSSDLIEALSARGIKLFFIDFRGVPYAALLGESQHGVVAVRQAQVKFCDGNTLPLAKQIIIGKIKNQRAVINHLAKYHHHPTLKKTTEQLKVNAAKAANSPDINVLLGFEGSSANLYFQSLKESNLFSASFEKREDRGSQEINNSMLNFGYAILSSYLLNAIVNAGLEPYLGLIHSQRPGKMSLVLDIMEEYRAWVVDRAVIKLRQQSKNILFLHPELKKNLIREIQMTCTKSYIYRKKKLKLEYIMQRQIYRLCGHFYGDQTYKPYLFKW